MLKHIFKLIWKKRQTNSLLLFELFFSFILLFIIMSILMWLLSNSLQSRGFEYEHVYDLTIEPLEDGGIKHTDDEIIEFLKNIDNIENVTIQSRNYEFRLSESTALKCQYNNEKNFFPNLFGIDEDWEKVFKPLFIEGRAINSTDLSEKYPPAYITFTLRKKMFGKRKAVGEIIEALNDEKFIIVGVLDQFKYLGDYSSEVSGLFVLRSNKGGESFTESGIQNINVNTLTAYFYRVFYIRSNGTKSVIFEEDVVNKLIAEFPGLEIKITALNELREDYLKRTFVPIILVSIVCGFLILNVLIGLFGQLWYGISQRKAEIGLRMAIGAWRGKIYRQLISEMLVLTFIAIVPAIFVAIQFPLLGVLGFNSTIYLIAIIQSIFILFILVTLSCLLPARRASCLQPAISLHEE